MAAIWRISNYHENLHSRPLPGKTSVDPPLDLGDCSGVQFQFCCQDIAPIAYFSIYFESDAGWYSATFFPEKSGWNTITIDKAATGTEGKPADWNAIKTIRLSAWRGGDTDTEMLIGDLRKVGTLGQDVFVAILRCDSAARSQPGEEKSTAQFASNVAELFQEAGLACATLSDLDITAAELGEAKLVVLPHNPTMPARTVEELSKYLKGGGKLLTDDRANKPRMLLAMAGYLAPELWERASAAAPNDPGPRRLSRHLVVYAREIR